MTRYLPIYLLLAEKTRVGENSFIKFVFTSICYLYEAQFQSDTA